MVNNQGSNRKQIRMRFNRNFYAIRNKIMFTKSIPTSSGVNLLILDIITNDINPIIKEVLDGSDENGFEEHVEITCSLNEEQNEIFETLKRELSLTDKSIYVLGLVLCLYNKG